MKFSQIWRAVLLMCALPLAAEAATRFVAHTGTDGPNCGLDAVTACRSVSRAIALAAPGDTIIVGPGRYGDLNRNGVLGDIPGEEVGSAGCSCVVSMNKNVIILSSAGAAVTIIDGTSVDVVQTVVVLSTGGEFGRPGKGFTVTETGRTNNQGRRDGHGIGIDASGVKVRGNQVVASDPRDGSDGTGIFTVNSASIRIEGNLASNWFRGISVLGPSAAVVSKNQVTGNDRGIFAAGGSITGNVATANGIGIHATQGATVSGNATTMNFYGVWLSPPFTGAVTRNNVVGNRLCGLVNDQVVAANATNNYWGVTSGPGDPPASNVCNSGSGTTTTSPFAATPFKVQILKP